MSRPRRSTVGGAIVLCLALLVPVPLADNAGEIRTRAFRLLNQGVAAYKSGEYATAVTRLEEAARIALSSFRANYYLGLALIGARRYAESIHSLNVALDLDPSHLRALVALGDANLKLGDLNEARAAYFRALKLRPAYSPSLDGLARVYEAESKIDEAISHFRRAIASDRGNAAAHTHLGDLFLRQDRFEEAVELLEEAVRPDFAAGLNRLALAYGRLGLDNLAVATIQQAIELEPKLAAHRVTLGKLQLDQGFLIAAVESFREALGLDEGHPEALLGLAEVDRRKGDYAGALAQIERALLDPHLSAALRQELDEYRARLEREVVLVAELEGRIAEGQASPEDHAAMAMILAGRGLWDSAAKIQALGPTTLEHRERLAYMLFQAGRFGDAQQLYSELAQQTGRGELELNNGVTLALLGNDTAAVEAYRRTLEIAPERLRARVYLGNSLLRLGDRPGAVEAYRAFLDQRSEGEAAERVRRILKQLAPVTGETGAPPSSSPDAASGGVLPR